MTTTWKNILYVCLAAGLLQVILVDLITQQNNYNEIPSNNAKLEQAISNVVRLNYKEPYVTNLSAANTFIIRWGIDPRDIELYGSWLADHSQHGGMDVNASTNDWCVSLLHRCKCGTIADVLILQQKKP